MIEYGVDTVHLSRGNDRVSQSRSQMFAIDDRLFGKNVLVVENEWLIAEDLRGVLMSQGVNVVGPVSSVSQAFNLIEQGDRIDAAVLDVHLGSGLDVYPIAKALQERGIPFLFTTGYDQRGIRGDFAGSPHLIKPYIPSSIGPALVAATSPRADTPSRPGRRLDARRR